MTNSVSCSETSSKGIPGKERGEPGLKEKGKLVLLNA